MTNRRLACAAGALIVCAGTAWGQSITYRTVAQTGDSAPGTSSTFSSFGDVTVNNDGLAAFTGVLTNQAGLDPNTQGVWGEWPFQFSSITIPQLQLAVLEGDVAVGAINPSTFEDFNGVTVATTNFPGIVDIDGAGRLVFYAELREDATPVASVFPAGIWSTTFDSSGNATTVNVAAGGQSAPGTSKNWLLDGIQRSFGAPNAPSVTSTGQILFPASVPPDPGGTLRETGVWVDDALGLNLYAAPGFPVDLPGSIQRQVTERAYNVHGELAFVASADDDLFTSQSSLFVLGPGGSQRVVGTTGFSSSQDVEFGGFGIPSLNDRGSLAFRAVLTGRPITDQFFQNQQTIYFSDGSTNGLTRIVSEFDTHPSLGPAEVFRSFSDALINANDMIVFEAQIGIEDRNQPQNNTLDDSIWAWNADGTGSLELIARGGELIPGIGTFVSGTVPIPQPNSDLVLNAQGQVAFEWEIEIGSGTRRGIWAWSNTNGLREVAREGDNESRFGGSGSNIVNGRLTLVKNSGGQDSRPSGLSENGKLAFVASLTDGEIVVVADLGLITPPASLCSADLDGDFDVDNDDFSILAASFGASVGDPAYNPAADLDENGTVDLDDFSILAGQLGNGPAQCDPNF